MTEAERLIWEMRDVVADLEDANEYPTRAERRAHGAGVAWAKAQMYRRLDAMMTAAVCGTPIPTGPLVAHGWDDIHGNTGTTARNA